MKETVSTTITQDSQISLPARVQRALGVKPDDRIDITIDHQSVTL
jgi:bifunctional DNA-binding transcriptional regulator/antitoxin component of YhaV-PrlF toxin-antitoxin module